MDSSMNHRRRLLFVQLLSLRKGTFICTETQVQDNVAARQLQTISNICRFVSGLGLLSDEQELSFNSERDKAFPPMARMTHTRSNTRSMDKELRVESRLRNKILNMSRQSCQDLRKLGSFEHLPTVNLVGAKSTYNKGFGAIAMFTVTEVSR